MKLLFIIILFITSHSDAQIINGWRTGGGGSGLPVARDNLLMNESFENVADPWENWDDLSQSAGRPWSRQQSPTQAFEGTYSFRAEVRSGCDGYASSGYRSELASPQQIGGGDLDDDGIMWYGIAIYFQDPVSGGNWQGSFGGHFLQWHPTSQTGSAVLALYGNDGEWDLTTNPGGGGGGTHHNNGQITAGWHSIVLKVNWGTSVPFSAGYVKGWVDGVLKWNLTGLNWQTGRYQKLGMNRWGSCATPGCPNGNQGPCNTWTLYYDSYRVGNSSATFNDVAPTQVLPELF